MTLRFGDVPRLGLTGMRSRPGRTVLTALGIAIGIAALVSVVGISVFEPRRPAGRARPARHQPAPGACRTGRVRRGRRPPRGGPRHGAPGRSGRAGGGRRQRVGHGAAHGSDLRAGDRGDLGDGRRGRPARHAGRDRADRPLARRGALGHADRGPRRHRGAPVGHHVADRVTAGVDRRSVVRGRRHPRSGAVARQPRLVGVHRW